MKQRKFGINTLPFLVVSTVLSVAFGCSSRSQEKDEITSKNLIQAGQRNINRTIVDNKLEYTILSQDAFEAKTKTHEIKKINSLEAMEALKPWVDGSRINLNGNPSIRNNPSLDGSLIFGIQLSLIAQPMIFGSVITQVSDQKNEDLGELKLADIPPFQIKLVLHQTTDHSSSISVLDCGADCSTVSNQQESLLEIPVLGVDQQKNVIFLDLASLGQELDLVAIRRGDTTLERFKSKSSRTVRFDYSHSTLVFDVEARLVDKKARDDDPQALETVVTNRWFLKSESKFNPTFVSRKATSGVGFFMTEKSVDPLIQRWDFDLRNENQGIKYYIKNVPQEYQPYFASAFDSWNNKLKPIIGKKVFRYKFISEGDPRSDLLVAGDIRYNILEWDLLNKASYGGLGPSLANQYTGEIFHANVLIQGPTIVDIYSKWFKVNKDADVLRASGKAEDAEKLLAKSNREIRSQIHGLAARTFQIKLGTHLQMRIHAQQPSLEDPMMSKEDFDPIPVGYTYQEYMAGYFHDTVTHELGHNLGLRHNFRGSLGASEGANQLGGVSRSIMEYLGRGYRYLDDIGEYDLMAISYGYRGDLPKHTDWYCTDEDSADLNDSSKSAECSSNDATRDPFGYYQSRLERIVDLLVARGQTSVPNWSVSELKSQLQESLTGLGVYAVSADQTASTWTNFFLGGDRPVRTSDVKVYVLGTIKATLCNPSLDREADLKPVAGANLVRENLAELRKVSTKILKPVFLSSSLICSTLL